MNASSKPPMPDGDSRTPVITTRGGVPYGFTEATVWFAEGARVALLTCEQCGAAVLVDSRDEWDRPQQHADWHFENHHQAVARVEQ